MKRLTDVGYWEENWWQQQHPRRLWLYRDVDFETIRLLRNAGRRLERDRPLAGEGGLPPEAQVNPRRILELGAGGSRVLPYVARRFGYRVSGSDFSWRGCRLLGANLARQGAAGDVLCEDLFQSALRAETFDLVYSSGLIEHFDDTRAVLAEHFRLVRPGGALIVIVPNLQGVQGRIWKRLAPPLWSIHHVFGPEDLASILKTLGLAQVRAGYLGSFFIHIGRGAEWSGVKRWPRWLQLAAPASVRLVNGLISFGFRLLPLRPHSRALSPAFFAEGIKPRV
ncbi:MAG: class I SAM-dependent methyltransferase [Terriglobia bacterium]